VSMSLAIFLSYMLFSGVMGNVVAGVTAVLVILNSLLASRDGDVGTNWLRKLLNVSLALKLITISLIAYVATITIVFGADNLRKRYIKDINLVLLSNTGDLTGGEMKLISNGDTTTQFSESGKFRFEKVSVVDSITIIASSGVRKASLKFLWKEGRDEIIRFRHPSKPMPLTCSFRSITPEGIDVILNPSRSKERHTVLGENTFIVENPVLNQLRQLKNKFADAINQAARVSRKRRNVEGINTQLTVETRTIYDPGLLEKVMPDQPWAVDFDYQVIGKTPHVDYSTIEFRRSMTLDDLRSEGRENARILYSMVSDGTLPPNFGRTRILTTPSLEQVDLSVDPCGGTTVSMDLREILEVPAISLHVIVIKNSQSHPVNLGALHYKSNEAIALRTINDDFDTKSRSETMSGNKWIPADFNLDPDQSIIIPLAISFKQPPAEEVFNTQAPAHEHPFEKKLSSLSADMRSKFLTNNVSLDFWYDLTPDDRDKIGWGVFNFIKKNPRLAQNDFPGTDDFNDYVFVYGPSYDISFIEVDREKYPVRAYDPAVTLLVGGQNTLPSDEAREEISFYEEHAASCPYFFSLTSSGWEKEDVFLYAQNSEERFAFDTVRIKYFNGKILIREIDPERSFVDYLKIVEVTPEGDTINHFSSNDLLRSVDTQFQTFDQGDSLLLNFTERSTGGSVYWLVSKGYYLSYQQHPEFRLQKKSLEVSDAGFHRPD
jgi:hypothetical protein